MNNFIGRLWKYLIGLSIGSVVFYYIYTNKSNETGVEFCYLPNCRVLKDIRSKKIVLNDNQTDSIPLNALDDRLRLLLLEGDVNFELSDTKSKPCKIYRIEGSDDETHFAVIKNCPKKAIVLELN